MPRILFSICFLLTAVAGFSQAVKHVVLISIDGFRPDFYLDTSWQAPHLRKLLQSGVYASNVRSVVPSVTYPAHTTIVTGALPARHGLYYNAPIRRKSVHLRCLFPPRQKIREMRAATGSWPAALNTRKGCVEKLNRDLKGIGPGVYLLKVSGKTATYTSRVIRR